MIHFIAIIAQLPNSCRELRRGLERLFLQPRRAKKSTKMGDKVELNLLL